MSQLKKQNKLPFNNGIGDDLRITLDTVVKIGELLSTHKQGDQNSDFLPWENWNLPFKEKREATDKSSNKQLLNDGTLSLLNDAYKVLNVYKNSVRSIEIKVDQIDPNPFWDMKYCRMLMSRIKFWAIVINEVGIDSGFHCVMAVRKYNGKYQTINHHHQLAALQLMRVDTVTVPLIDLTDLQMEKCLGFERF